MQSRKKANRLPLLLFAAAGLAVTNLRAQEFSGVVVDSLSNGNIYRIVAWNESKRDSAVYHVFVPDGIKALRGVFIHQHGCGMEGRGAAAAYDIQYQAFGKKWGLAIVGPDLYYESGCYTWREPNSGSAQSLMGSLRQVGEVSGYRELSGVPWLLWGHSGGGYWTIAMLREFPERVLAAFCYSPVYNAQWDYPEHALQVPLMIRHAGASDLDRSWEASVNIFKKMRKAGGLVSIAYTPYQSHNHAFVRHMAIPFYEAVLAQRLPMGENAAELGLNDMDLSRGWLGDNKHINTYSSGDYAGDPLQLSWLPDSATAAKWKEYVITGDVIDRTPPPAPYDVKAKRIHNREVELSWRADADVESGIKQFCIYDGEQLIARFPEQDVYQRFDTNGDNAIGFTALAEMRVVLTLAESSDANLRVSTVNHAGLHSTRTSLTEHVVPK
ncbi:hypothetical protein SAMN05421747_11812 [Parapedobacter composti]|uniref:Prolyl oligopeptidase family protein n=1 Tax=Parapedobacter composti TaxID=623281 RepID=A0A1I1L0Q0_9SPHI|nr:hypothetical protein [Parapedobacter composti]SFC66505.1 hypothetical protein SAMN05421747_11812 [Parapedobacter composti]